MKRVAAIHDLSGVGKCSLTIVLPVLNVMGISCSPLPTAILSSHTGFDDFTFLDCSAQMKPTLEHWRKIGVEFDMIYSGFLGSSTQMELVEFASELFPGVRLLVDPVMGDNGKIYKTYTDQMCQNMVKLAKKADIITPNITEAAIMLGKDYSEAPKSKEQASAWLGELSCNNAVALTGLRFSEDFVHTAWIDPHGCTGFVKTPYIGGEFNGTGDLFATVLCGSILNGATLEQSVKKAAEFVSLCAKETPPSAVEGICFETSLTQLSR